MLAPLVSVVIPAYNEEANITRTLTEVVDHLSHQPYRSEVIVVDDGSCDRTRDFVEAIRKEHPFVQLLSYRQNRGRGYAVQQGALAAEGEYTLVMDADSSISICEIDRFLPYLQQGFQVVIGSRYVPEARATVPQPWLRLVMGWIYRHLCRLLIVRGVSDYNCGFKVYDSQARGLLFCRQRMHDWSFDAELIFLAHRFSLRLKEVPVRWGYRATSKVRPFRDGIQAFVNLLRIRLNSLWGRYA